MSNDPGPGWPVFACHCLNIRLYQRIVNGGLPQQQQNASTEYQPLYVGDDGINISHNELTLRNRSPVVADSSSTTGRSQKILVTCLVCEAAAYSVKTEVPLDEDAKEGPILPTEDWAERDTLRSKSGFVDVHVGKGGCIAEDEIKRIMSSPSYSQYFSLTLPPASHILSTAAPAVLPHARLTIPPTHSFLPSLPPFLPLPPFTPSHPIFLHLSSIVTACSNGARRDAEKRIEEFAKQELAQLEEHETALRTQLEQLWWIVKEGLKKAERERDANLLSAMQSKRRSMSPRRAPPGADGVESSVVRNFVPSSTYHAPRTVHISATRPSALSASLATTSFHHPLAHQEANVGPSDSATAGLDRSTLNTSPPPYIYNASSSGSSSGSVSGSLASRSRPFKRNMDVSNDIAVTYRWYAIQEQEAESRKTKEREKGNKINGAAKKNRETAKATSSTGTGQQFSTGAAAAAAVEDSKLSTADSKQTGPSKKDGRRKVTFNVEPNVVTIKRDITAEVDEERVPENGDDLLFDMDGIESGHAERNGQRSVEKGQSEATAGIAFREAPERSQRSSKRQNDLKDAGLPQSFAALRPSSLPAPSSIRPPIRSRPDQEETKNRRSSPPQSSDPSSSKAKDINRQSSETNLSEEVLSPEQKNFLKLVAAESPSHRGLWKPGSDAWKIFNRSARQSAIMEEDEEDGVESSDANGVNAEYSEWRHYRRPDVVGSLPIPMAPIAQHKLGGASSLQPKTSLADRQGTLVPPLPVVVEEDEGGKEGKTAASIRKEVYAERNKFRGLDPGFLDFVEDDTDDLEAPDQDEDVGQVSASRSRQHALSIIKARNAVPPEGLWRSLAT